MEEISLELQHYIICRRGALARSFRGLSLFPLLPTSVYRRPHLVAIRCCCFDCFSLFGVSLSLFCAAKNATQSAISNEKKKQLVDRTRLPNFAFSEVHAMMSSSHLRISFASTTCWLAFLKPLLMIPSRPVSSSVNVVWGAKEPLGLSRLYLVSSIKVGR